MEPQIHSNFLSHSKLPFLNLPPPAQVLKKSAAELTQVIQQQITEIEVSLFKSSHDNPLDLMMSESWILSYSRPTQYHLPPNIPAHFKSQIGFLRLYYLPIPPFRNTAGFSPVLRTAVLGGTTVLLNLFIWCFTSVCFRVTLKAVPV